MQNHDHHSHSNLIALTYPSPWKWMSLMPVPGWRLLCQPKAQDSARRTACTPGRVGDTNSSRCWLKGMEKMLEQAPLNTLFSCIFSCIIIYLSFFLSFYLPIYLSIYLPTYLPIYLSIYLSMLVLGRLGRSPAPLARMLSELLQGLQVPRGGPPEAGIMGYTEAKKAHNESS